MSGGKRRHHRERERENREKRRGEEESGEPQADGLAEESSRGETEPKPTAVRTYYRKRNNGELGAFRAPPSSSAHNRRNYHHFKCKLRGRLK